LDYNNNMRLWYRTPAKEWEDALPVGNGRMGGMVFGRVEKDRIQLNDDTLWSGYPRDINNYNAINHLQQVRELIADEQYIKAERIVEEHMDGEWTESYMPLGDLYLTFDHDKADHYNRELDLNSAVVRTDYEHNGIHYSREVFVSAVDQVMVVHLSCSQSGALHFKAGLDSLHPHTIKSADNDKLFLVGNCPVHVEPDYVGKVDNSVVYKDDEGMRFSTGISILPRGGEITAGNDKELSVKGADSVIILVSTATAYRDTDKKGAEADQELITSCEKAFTRAKHCAYERLLERHVADYRRLYNRVALELGQSDQSQLPTDERVLGYKNGNHDPEFATLLFQYGRYLLISSSRAGTQAANLQGIWNQELRPPWSSNFTTNINVQMNYWSAEICNLSECHKPLIDLISGIQENGRKTASIHYGCRGWAAHHNVDIWRTTVPTKNRSFYFFWPLAGAWLCLHLWEHYAFTGNRDFLRDTAYPLMKDAALFCLDWLIENEDGYLVTSPSTSPENSFLSPEGEECGLSAGSTMDMSIIRQLFINCIDTAQILNMEQDFRKELEHILSRLLPFQIGRHGQLQEWSKDFEEVELGHRHSSHLFGLFPGNLIDIRTQQELAAAYQTSLERRQENGGGARGWPGAWCLHFWARLGNGEKAYWTLESAMRHETSYYSNLFNGRKAFQIDGNLGITSGIAEMLLQSHRGEIHILPALPVAWSEGQVRGLRARGGYEVDVYWQRGTAKHAAIRSDFSGICRIRTGQAHVYVQCEGNPVHINKNDSNVIEFDARAGHQYILTFN
jgi:alpha-L-fucosidase 2